MCKDSYFCNKIKQNTKREWWRNNCGRLCEACSSRRMLEKLFANPKSVVVVLLQQQLGHKHQVKNSRPHSVTTVYEPSRQDYCGLEAKTDFGPSARRAVVTRSGTRRWSPTSKTRPETRCHKSRELCYTVWHSTFNGFMAVQTQLGCFQNGTHLFLSSLCDSAALDKRPSGNDQLCLVELAGGDAQDITVILVVCRGRAGGARVVGGLLSVPGNLPPSAPSAGTFPKKPES